MVKERANDQKAADSVCDGGSEEYYYNYYQPGALEQGT